MDARDEIRPQLVERERDSLWMLTDPGTDAVRVVFTGRRGGSSSGSYSSLNLSDRVGDAAAAVESNRRKVASSGRLPERLEFVRQVHGATVIRAGSGGDQDGDALVSSESDSALGILTADCAPIALAGTAGVAMVHAGWRGLVAGVVERAAGEIGDLRAAWIGPCIKACCYEVGGEVIAAFSKSRLPVAGDDRVDIMDSAAHAVRAAGFSQVAVSGLCTACNEDLLFSHRRDKGAGRQGGFIALTKGVA